MESRDKLEKRVAELERELTALRAGAGVMRGVRKRATAEIAGLPLYDIAFGPDLSQGQFRGHARGIFALGDMATGVVAVGGLARGVIAIGGLAAGLFTLGGLSIGAAAAVGGLAIGGLAFGGGALGGIAIGGGAIGEYACGGGALGEHVVSATRRDAEAVAFFKEHGLEGMCSGGGYHRYR